MAVSCQTLPSYCYKCWWQALCEQLAQRHCVKWTACCWKCNILVTYRDHYHYTTVGITCRMYWILPLWLCQGVKSVLTFTLMTVPRCEECTHLYTYDCARVWRVYSHLHLWLCHGVKSTHIYTYDCAKVWRVYSPLHLWLCQGVKSVLTFTLMTVPRCEECTHLYLYDCAKVWRVYSPLHLWLCQGVKSVLTFTLMTMPRCEECTHLYTYDCARVWRVYSPLHLWLCQGVKSVLTFTFMTVSRCEECTHLYTYDCAKTVYCSEGVWKLLLYVSNVRADMHMEWPVTSEDAQEPSVLVQGVPRRCAVGHHWR